MKKVEEIIEILRNEVKAYFSNDTTGHNIDHLERTLNYALYFFNVRLESVYGKRKSFI